MSDLILTILFWLGVVMIGAFVVAGLASSKVRAMMQRPADDMVRRDRERWGSRTTDEGEQR
ncbi:MAG TPA: hypothetical protein VFY11_12370 [Nocardioidaceae bacterium]|jgi:hypothetical protein|nr:hypothetical protein [Nocardioidaceae bacterium]